MMSASTGCPMSACRRACGVARFVRSVEESKALMTNPMPKVIISASGMATGGRVLHHLKHYAPDPRNTILFAGFQAGGTRGAAMVGGADSIKIHGAYVPVRAEVKNLDMLSGHADADEILRWLRGFKSPPKMTFITHGEPAASDALRRRIEEELSGPARCPSTASRSTDMSDDGPASELPSHDAANSVRARRLGIDTQYEAIIFMHKDCQVCRSEGFAAHTACPACKANGRRVIATLYQVTSPLVGPDEAILSESGLEAARLAGRRTHHDRPSAAARFAEPSAQPHLRQRLKRAGLPCHHRRHRRRPIFRHPPVVVPDRLRLAAARTTRRCWRSPTRWSRPAIA